MFGIFDKHIQLYLVQAQVIGRMDVDFVSTNLYRERGSP